jgi:hypothetical protein
MNKNPESNGQTLVTYINSLEHFEFSGSKGPVYDHMGAIIADSILQAGLNYENVVFPRVKPF